MSEAERKKLAERMQKQVQHDLDDVNSSMEALDKRTREGRESAKNLLKYEQEDEDRRSDIARTQQLLDVTIKRLEEMNLISGPDSGGVKRSRSRAGVRGESAQILRILLVAAILGTLAGFGLAYLAETTTRASTRRKRFGGVGVAIMGHIPFVLEKRKERIRGDSGKAAS